MALGMDMLAGILRFNLIGDGQGLEDMPAGAAAG